MTSVQGLPYTITQAHVPAPTDPARPNNRFMTGIRRIGNCLKMPKTRLTSEACFVSAGFLVMGAAVAIACTVAALPLAGIVLAVGGTLVVGGLIMMAIRNHQTRNRPPEPCRNPHVNPYAFWRPAATNRFGASSSNEANPNPLEGILNLSYVHDENQSDHKNPPIPLKEVQILHETDRRTSSSET